jgi:hypothetical protein
MALGPCPAAEAKKKALGAQARVANGENPAEEVQKRREDITLADYVESHFLPHQRSAKRNWKDDEWLMAKRILPLRGKRRLGTSRRSTCSSFATPSERRPPSPRRTGTCAAWSGRYPWPTGGVSWTRVISPSYPIIFLENLMTDRKSIASDLFRSAALVEDPPFWFLSFGLQLRPNGQTRQ